MRNKRMYLWIANIIWIGLCVLGSYIIWTRNIDATGVIQTFKLRLITFMMWLIPFLTLLSIQFVWIFVHLKNRKNS